MINLSCPSVGLVRLGRLTVILIGFLSLLAPVVLADGPGDLDPTFGNSGVVTTTVGDNSRAFAVAIQPDGHIIVAGDAYLDGAPFGLFDFALARYTPDGQLDPSFGVAGMITTPIDGSATALDLAVQSNGNIVAAGISRSSGSFNILEDFALARYTLGGQLDPSFSDDGLVTTTIGTEGGGYGLVLQPDGKIVVAGVSHHAGGGSDFTLVRYASNGQLDLSFGDDGIVTTTIGSDAWGFDVALQADNKILVAGKSDNHFALARYTSAGQLDPTFSDDGLVTTAIGAKAAGNSLALQPDGKIIVAGTSDNHSALARYTSAGQLDPSFSDDGLVTTTMMSGALGFDVALQPDGKIVVAGTEGFGGGFALARYTSSGQLDPSFSDDGLVTTTIGALGNNGFDVALQPDGKIVVAGNSYHPGGGFGAIEDFALVRYLGEPSGQISAVYLPLVVKGIIQ